MQPQEMELHSVRKTTSEVPEILSRVEYMPCEL